MNANLDTIAEMEGQIASLLSEAEQAKQTAADKEREARNVRDSIAPMVEQLVREQGLDALTDKRVVRHIARAFHLRRRNASGLHELTKELFSAYKNDGAQLLFNSMGKNNPEFRVRLQGYDTAIPLPERFPEILEAFSGTLKFVTPDTLNPGYDTELVEVREGWSGGWKVRNHSSDLPAKDCATIEEALAEAMTQLRFYFIPEHPVTGTFTLTYT